MQSNMRVFYLYVVCLITLIMFVAGIISGVYNLARLFYPTSYVFFEDNQQVSRTYSIYGEIQETRAVRIDEETKKEKDQNTIRKNNYKKEAIKDVIISGLVITIGFLLYKYHWNTIEKERNVKEN